MHTLIIGHRGVGKTLLLKRLQKAFPKGVCLCLDEEIEKDHGPIAAIFKDKGEAHFRKLEIEKFKNLLSRFKEKVRPVFIALGAGFEGAMPADWDVVWVQRDVKVQDFLFPNRPNLGEGLQMPAELFSVRQTRYQSLATQELTLREGDVESIPEERDFFASEIKDLGGCLTLLPYQLESKEFKYWIHRRLTWGLKYFEVRDDLLSIAEIKDVLRKIPKENIILSFRRREVFDQSLVFAEQVALVDWPMEYGEVSKDLKEKFFYSLHSEAADFEKHLKIIGNTPSAFKWSPMVANIQQLRQGHEWQKKNPELRSFLPRSENGRWAWYRLVTKGQMPVQFLREGTGSSLDQPTLLQWLARGKTKKLAAVIGWPVKHSWTPLFHQEFFKKKDVDVFALDFSEAELDKNAFSFLEELGFKAFAVTSPLKAWAGRILKNNSFINTLVWQKKRFRWEGFNTDADGFIKLVEDIFKKESSGKTTAIWGGGGVLESLRQVLPQASFYSARTSLPREGFAALDQPEFVIWAAGGQTNSTPPPTWKPQVVYDLSYTADSPAIAYAHKMGAKYVSGQAMFVAQALKQQEIWSRYEF